MFLGPCQAYEYVLLNRLKTINEEFRSEEEKPIFKPSLHRNIWL